MEVLEVDIGFQPSLLTGRGAFGKGSIDLGGLQVTETLYFKEIWGTQSDGSKGATFYEPTAIPSGFNLLGHYSRSNTMPLAASVLVAKDITGHPSHGALKRPIDYTLVWTSEGLNLGQHEDGYIWLPIPPIGYKVVGHVVTTTPEKPSIDKVRCVRSDFTDSIEVDTWIWGVKMSNRSMDVSTTRPITTTKGLSIPVGTFFARAGRSETHDLACLKMLNEYPYLAMPDSLQITKMINTYSPWVYFHPDEQYFPSSVLWFFENGVTLHENGKNPQTVINDGDNLPKTGTQDDAFLDLPPDQTRKDKVRKGFLNDAIAYIHVKPALAGTHTDLTIWLYYPFNGGGKFQLGPFLIDLGKLGEHVSDWEHITLRIDNYHGMLKAIYLSRHSAGKWFLPQEFEYVDNGTRPVVYASLHGHAHYNTPKYHLHGKSHIDAMDIKVFYDQLLEMNSESPWGEPFGFGVRDDTAKSKHVMDIASSYNVVCVDNKKFDMEPWLSYTGRWGPKITYGFTEEVMKAASELPANIRDFAIKLLHKLPAELLGEEGPTGPKMRDSWTGDEKVEPLEREALILEVSEALNMRCTKQHFTNQLPWCPKESHRLHPYMDQWQ
ncbi:hypothetical protein L6452_30167 [Arctium lappa]|uniref:Uncharacterized protein n=1 Tax=Arctium lappa TaxID=4217 RepID=A0ACB8ZIA4_ARCLA|nr:hypothetical protein L6452_30167 [Arctium lappa]